MGVTLSSDFNIPPSRSLGFLLEGMQHINGVGSTCGVNHAIDSGIVPYPEFLDTLADGRHGLEVIGLFAPLHLFELVTRVVPGVLGKVPQALERVAKKSQGFHGVEYTGLDIVGQAEFGGLQVPA